jgi:hypothetical protein
MNTVTKRAATRTATFAGRKGAKTAAKHPVRSSRFAAAGTKVAAKGAKSGLKARSTVRSLQGKKSTKQQVAPYAAAGGVAVVLIVVTVVVLRQRRVDDADAGDRDFGTPAPGADAPESAPDADTDSGSGSDSPNDPTLARKVEQAIYEVVPEAKGRVSVNSEYGVIYLRGEVADEGQRTKLAGAAGGVQGVDSVKNLLHTPSRPAPTKDS